MWCLMTFDFFDFKCFHFLYFVHLLVLGSGCALAALAHYDYPPTLSERSSVLESSCSLLPEVTARRFGLGTLGERTPGVSRGGTRGAKIYRQGHFGPDFITFSAQKPPAGRLKPNFINFRPKRPLRDDLLVTYKNIIYDIGTKILFLQ